MDATRERVPELPETPARYSRPYPAPVTYRALEAPQASGFEDLPSDLSLLPSRAATYSSRPADVGHSRPVSHLSALWISRGSQPPGRWSPPSHFATTRSVRLSPSLATSGSSEDLYVTQSLATRLGARLANPRSFPSAPRSFSGVSIRDLTEDTLTSKPLSTGIDPSAMRDVDNIGAPTPVNSSARASMTEQTARGRQRGSDTPQLSQRHSPVIPRAIPSTPLPHDPPDLPPDSAGDSLSEPRLHDMHRLTLMSRAIENFHSVNAAGFTDIDILQNFMAMGPGQLDAERHLHTPNLSELRYRMGSSHRMTFRYIAERVREFTELATQLGFAQGTFTLDPELDLETVLITEGWTEPRELHNTWYFYQERLRAFMNHYRHVRSALARYQRREERSNTLERSPSVAPTAFTDPVEVRQAYRRRMDRVGDVVYPEEFEEDLPERPSYPRWINPQPDPHLRPRASVHVAAQGPAETWRTPFQTEPPAPQRAADRPENWNSPRPREDVHRNPSQREYWQEARGPANAEHRGAPHADQARAEPRRGGTPPPGGEGPPCRPFVASTGPGPPAPPPGPPIPPRGFPPPDNPPNRPGSGNPPFDRRKPYVERKYTARDFPEFDGSVDSFLDWVTICDRFASESEEFAGQMARVLPERFVGLAAGWWGVVSQADATYFSESWPRL